MFESAEIGHKLGKREYEREEPKLRQRLLALQYKLLADAKFPVAEGSFKQAAALIGSVSIWASQIRRSANPHTPPVK